MIVLFVFFAIGFSRPERPPKKEGEIRNWKGKHHFSYDKSKETSSMKYTIDIGKNYRLLDDEIDIENVICEEYSLEIYSKSKEPSSWKKDFVLSGGSMWNCKTSFTRKIKSIDYEGKVNGLHHYYIETENAQMEDYIENANVEYIFNHENEENNNQQHKKKINVVQETMYNQSYVKLLSPSNVTLIDTSNKLPISYEIVGCDKKHCGIVTTQIDVVINGDVVSKDKETHIHSCSCKPNDCLCQTSMKLTDSRYRTLLKNEYIKIQLIMTFTSSTKRKIIPKFESNFFEVNTYRMLFLSPSPNEISYLNNKTLFSWEPTKTLLKRFPYVNFTICKREEHDSESEKYHFSDTVTETHLIKLKQKQIKLQISNEMYSKGEIIFGRFNFTDEYHSEIIESQYITIVSNNSIHILSPDIITRYDGNVKEISVKWDYFEEVTFKKVNIALFIRESKENEAKKLQRVKKIDVDTKSTTIPVGNLTLPPSSQYFIRISFRPYDNKKYKKITVLSEMFTIGIQGSFEITTQLHEDENKLYVYYNVINNVGKFSISIHEKRPFVSEKMINEKEVTDYKINENSSLVFAYEKGSIFRQYVLIKYNCIVSSNGCSEERYWLTEDIPFRETFNWNYNEETQQPKEIKKEILNWNCTSSKTSSSSSNFNNDNFEKDNWNGFENLDIKKITDLKYAGKQIMNQMNELCKRYVSIPFKFSIVTNNSYVHIPMKIHGFELQIVNFKLQKARCYVQIDVDLDLQLMSTIKGHYVITNETIPISPEISFPFEIPLGPILLSFGLFFTPKIGITVEGDVMMSTMLKYKKHYRYMVTMDSLNETQPLSTQFIDYTKNKHPSLQFAGLITSKIEPYFEASFKLGVGVYGSYAIYFHLDIVAGIQIKSKTRYPPFPPKKLYLNTTHAMRLKYGPHVYLKFGCSFKKEEYRQFIYDVFPAKFTHKIGLFKQENTNVSYAFSFENKYKYDNIDMLGFQDEIGRIANKLKIGFNPFNLFLQSDSLRDNYYTVSLLYYKDDFSFLQKIKNCIIGLGCTVEINGKEFYFIPPSSPNSLSNDKNQRIYCSLPYCKNCSLDETYCEKCDYGYQKNDVSLCVPIGKTCNFPKVYDKGKCIKCKGKTVYNYIKKQCLECPNGTIYQDNKCIICRDSQYYDKATKSCIDTEIENNKSNNTLGCEPPSVLEDNECVYCEHPDGYLDGKCKRCKNPYYWKDNYCVQCEKGLYYHNETDQCLNCTSGHVVDNFYCVLCEPHQEFLNGKCYDCKIGSGLNPETKKCETCKQFYYTKNNYCEYCEGIIVNNECTLCSGNTVINDNHTKCISCNEKLPGSGYYKDDCIICEEGYMINNNGICEKCQQNHINYLGKCIQCPDDSTYSKEYDYCMCKDTKKWFNGEKCVDGSQLNMKYDNNKQQLQCNEGYGMAYLYDKYQCIKCEDYGFTLQEGKCVCLDENYFLHYDKCLQCEKDMLGIVKERKDENYNKTQLSYKECICDGERGWKYVNGKQRCVTCERHNMTKINGNCECIEGNGIALLKNGYCVDCNQIGGIITEDDDKLCQCPSNQGFLMINEIMKCVNCSEYNQEMIDGYCNCGGYYDSKAGLLLIDGNCLTCKQRNGKIIRDSRGYYHCTCEEGKKWNEMKTMCV